MHGGLICPVGADELRFSIPGQRISHLVSHYFLAYPIGYTKWVLHKMSGWESRSFSLLGSLVDLSDCPQHSHRAASDRYVGLRLQCDRWWCVQVGFAGSPTAEGWMIEIHYLTKVLCLFRGRYKIWPQHFHILDAPHRSTNGKQTSPLLNYPSSPSIPIHPLDLYPWRFSTGYHFL